jgi:hypothetical protein
MTEKQPWQKALEWLEKKPRTTFGCYYKYHIRKALKLCQKLTIEKVFTEICFPKVSPFSYEELKKRLLEEIE